MKELFARIAVFTLVLASLAFAKDKDHSAEYQAGTFSSTGSVSDGSYSSCNGGGCSAYSAAHNLHFVNTSDGMYAIEAPVSVAGTFFAGMANNGNAPTVHKAWFMDNLHEGDKVIFVAKCNMKHSQHRCEFWLPNPDKQGKEIATLGSFSPAVAKTNTTALCGTGKLNQAVESQVCTPPVAPQPASEITSSLPVPPVVRPLTSADRQNWIGAFNKVQRENKIVCYAEIVGDALIIHSERAGSLRFHTQLANPTFTSQLQQMGFLTFVYTNDDDQKFEYDVNNNSAVTVEH